MLTSVESAQHTALDARAVASGRLYVEDQLRKARDEEHAAGLRRADAVTRAARAASTLAAEQAALSGLRSQLVDIESAYREVVAQVEQAHAAAVDQRARAAAAWATARSKFDTLAAEFAGLAGEQIPEILRGLDRKLLDVGTECSAAASLTELSIAAVERAGRELAMRSQQLQDVTSAKIAAEKSVDLAHAQHARAAEHVAEIDGEIERCRACVRNSEAKLRAIC